MADSTTTPQTTVILPPANAHVRIPAPFVFDGKRDGFTALSWLRAVHRYFVAAALNPATFTIHAIAYLAAAPAQWFDGSGLPDECHFKDVFVPAFKKEFVPINFARNCRSRLGKLELTSDFTTFITEFKMLLTALHADADNTPHAIAVIDDFARAAFIDNSPQLLQQMLLAYEISNPTVTLSELFSLSEQYDRIFHFKPDPRDPTSSSTSATSAAPTLSSLMSATPALPPTIPMDLDNLSLLFNMLSRHQQNNNKNRQPYSQNRNQGSNNIAPRAPLTDAERDRCRRQGLCFKCRQQGHSSFNCPERQGPGFVNNIVLNADCSPSPSPEAGKGPSN
ncbi:hypothetical protein EDD11_010610 [Mortierella claussenii]|nr:hypothetical protein EDD11_010610 [Mortierella claussenii]